MESPEFDNSSFFDQSREFTMNELNIDDLVRGKISYGSFDFFSDAAHRSYIIPVIAARGIEDGPTLGLLATVHGNELQGIPVIHELISDIEVTELRGTIIAIPVVNMHGYLTQKRHFIDKKDLNRAMPGKKIGTPSEMFAYRFLNRVITKFDYMIDIHTASFGRINSHYVRADLTKPEVRKMALLQDSSIIVNTSKPTGSFRSEANKIGVPTITLELGNPQQFQDKMIYFGLSGVRNVMIHLGMLDGEYQYEKESIICKTSYWLRVDMGGILYVEPKLLQKLKKNEEIATLTDMYGRPIKKYRCPQNGIVIGKSTNPVSYTGGRILHLGIQGDIEEIVEEDDLVDDSDDY